MSTNFNFNILIEPLDFIIDILMLICVLYVLFAKRVNKTMMYSYQNLLYSDESNFFIN